MPPRNVPTKRPWTATEFEAVLHGQDANSPALRGRQPGAVESVRQGIHSWHRKLDVSELSQVMLQVLESPRPRAWCPICRTSV